MDDGTVVSVKIDIDRERRGATVDFAGTSAQVPTNFNAPISVCRAAVLYVFRTLVDDDIPMNEGCLRPITLKVPDRFDAEPQAAGRRGRRQCRDQPSGHRRALWRAGRGGGKRKGR
jgi:5-oxoprolinase (ATP-hydrolysing)